MSEFDDLAGEYVLGTLRGPARDEFAARLAREPALADAVAGWERRLNPVAQSLPRAKLPPGLWQRIENVIAELLGGTLTIRAGEGDWVQIGRGAWIKHLLLDEKAGTRSLLLRLDPGGTLPAHKHVSTEECLVLEGEMIIGGVRFGEGDYHVAPAGFVHSELTSRTGGLIFIRTGAHQPRP